MTERCRVFIAIGSNIEPTRHIPLAIDRLRALPETELLAVSGWYRTRPWGIEDQPEFVNLAAGLETGLTPATLLAETQAIERDLGRVRELRNGPRTIDLDLLLFGDLILDEPALRLPHPGLIERDFMLIPLIEIAPDAIHPALGLRLGELTDGLRERQIIARLP